MAQPLYQRLTPSRSTTIVAVAVTNRASLWLGPDHLLLVHSNGYTETYKRFYFRDIQALTVQQTSASTFLNRVLVILCFLLGVGVIAAGEVSAKITLSIFAGLFIGIGVINLIKGKTCRCCLRTAVQTEVLPPLHRVKYAHKILARLRPLILAAQGGESAPAQSAGTPTADAPASMEPTIPPPDFGSLAP